MVHYMKDTTTQWNGERSSKHVKYQRVPYQSKNVWEVRKIPSHMRQTWFVFMFFKNREVSRQQESIWSSLFLDSSFKTPIPARGGICQCRHCQQQCKIWASGVNFSIFTHFFVFFFLQKLLKLGEIDGVKFLAWKSGGVKFLTNSMSVPS